MNKRKVLRVAAPLIIVVAIVGIWAFKNAVESTEEAPQPGQSGTEIVLTEEEQDDFALDVSALDLEKLTSYGLPIVIDFGAGWCSPCKQFAPILEAMHDEMLGKAIIKYVDTEDNADIAADFPISVIPTQVFINPDGTPYAASADLGVEFKTYTYKDSGAAAFTVHEGALTEEKLRAILINMGASE